MIAGFLTSPSSFIRPWQVGQARTSTASVRAELANRRVLKPIPQLADVDLGPLGIRLYQRLWACFRPSLLKVAVVRDECRDLLCKVERGKSLVFCQQPRYFR